MQKAWRIVGAAGALGTIGFARAAGETAAWSANADEVRAIVAEMLADAETRSSLADGGATAGYDKGFFISDGTGAFRLQVGGQQQIRYVANFRDNGGGATDDFVSSFYLPRTRVFFAGNVFEPGLTYRVMLDVSQSTGTGFLQDAWAAYAFDENWTIRAGQGITWFYREWQMGDVKMLTVERSLNSLVFGQARSQFVDAKFQNDDVRVVGTVSDGLRSTNTDLGAQPADVGVTGRAEWKFAGDWKQLTDEFRSPRGSSYAGALGAAAHYEVGPDTRVAGTDEQGLFAWTADVLVKGDGWNFLAAGVGYHVADEAGVTDANFDDFGLLVEGGIHVTDDLELIARYDGIFPDRDRAANDDFHALTFGFNYFLHGQGARFSLGVLWALDDTVGTTAGNFGNLGARTPASTAYGLLPSVEDNQVAIMAQFQLLF